jgi:hypothetical protein
MKSADVMRMVAGSFVLVLLVALVAVAGFRWIVLPAVANRANEILLADEIQKLKDLQEEKVKVEDFIRCLSIPSFSDGVQVEKLRTSKEEALDDINKEIKEKEALILSKKKSP